MIKTYSTCPTSTCPALSARPLRLRRWSSAAVLVLSGVLAAPVFAAQTNEKDAPEKEGDIVIGETGPQKGDTQKGDKEQADRSVAETGVLTRSVIINRMEPVEALIDQRTPGAIKGTIKDRVISRTPLPETRIPTTRVPNIDIPDTSLPGEPIEDDPVKGGMRAPANIEPLKPTRRSVSGRQPAVIVAKPRGAEQIGELQGPRGQHIAVGLDFSGNDIGVSRATPVPGRAPTSRYLQGGIVWRASIDGRAFDVGSFRDPRAQHSLIPPEEIKGDDIAPEPAQTGSWRIPLDEKYLGRDDVARLTIDFFQIDARVPSDTELNLTTLDRILEGARRLDAVTGKELYAALYADIDQERERARDLQQQQDLQ